MKVRTLAAILGTAFPCSACAVYLDPDGLGQALVYPYYTVQSASGNAFNTYLSVVNHSAEAKALRVRFREGRNGAEVGSFNLFLSPNDAWVGAVVPGGSGATLLARDRSCIDGLFAIDFSPGAFPYLEFRNTQYTGARDDGAGVGLDRTREGYVEILEMGVLTGAAAAAVTQNSAGLPANCSAVNNNGALPMAAPTGGLSGTLTLINVANGQDFTVNADALGDLATQPYYRLPADPYPAFDAAEITPVSIVVDGGAVYRSVWTRPVDAVSAVFMRSEWQGEYVLDAGTRSRTDFVVTFPTRQYYVRADGADLPFTEPRIWREGCWLNDEFAPRRGEPMTLSYANREAATAVAGGSGFISVPGPSACSSIGVFTTRNPSPHTGTGPQSALTGSINTIVFHVSPVFQNGWVAGQWRNEVFPKNSLSSSSRMQRDGTVTPGPHAFTGLPTTGFALRTFENGTLTCAGASCQGNYGGAFPLTFQRDIRAN